MLNAKGANKYYRRSRISEWKFRLLVRYFTLDLSATEVARLTNLTRKTVTVIFLKIRRRIAQECALTSPFTTGEIKADQGHSCAVCICGKRGCSISKKTPVFALLKHNDYLYVEMLPDCQKAALRALIRGHEVVDGMLEMNGWHGFDALIDAKYERPFKVNRRISLDTAEPSQYSDREIETFWNFARRRLEKFHGVSNRTFHLHLKECEWRYNMRQRDLYTELLRLLRKHPL
ncbi:MAG: transposase [Pyrinomonadaceae bacterium]|nr:transposase [Pyrinomonadaceae bacterium]